MTFHLSAEAAQDLDDIFLYWSGRAGYPVADRLIDAIVERFWLVGEYPEAGKPAHKLAPGVRCFPAGKYLIYYRKNIDRIEILHIFHGVREQIGAFRKRSKHR